MTGSDKQAKQEGKETSCRLVQVIKLLVDQFGKFEYLVAHCVIIISIRLNITFFIPKTKSVYRDNILITLSLLYCRLYEVGEDLFLEGDEVFPDVRIGNRSECERENDALAGFYQEPQAFGIIFGAKERLFVK